MKQTVYARPRLRSHYLLRYCASLALYYSGALTLYRFSRRIRKHARTTVLAYHGFQDHLPYIDMYLSPALFRRQMRYVARQYNVISLGEYVRLGRLGRSPATDTVVITIDDGYLDNYTVALPLCRELGICMSVFVTTDCINQGKPTFIAALLWAVHNAKADRIASLGYGLPGFLLQTYAQKEAAIKALDGVAKSLSIAERERFLQAIVVAVGCSAEEMAAQCRMLDWAKLREMQAAGMEIGAHSRTHAVLARLSDSDIAAEIDGSLAEVSRQLPASSGIFAYPYGGEMEVTPRVIEVCRRSAATAAVVLSEEFPEGHGLYAIGRDMLSLDRTVTPWGTFSRALFACEISGLMGRLRLVRKIKTSEYKYRLGHPMANPLLDSFLALESLLVFFI